MPASSALLPLRLLPLLAGLLLIAIAATPATAHQLIYAPEPAADAAFDAGVTTALRQAPIMDITNPRWPAARQVGKVNGTALSKMGAGEMERTLRAGWVRHAVGGPMGGHVGVDEIRPSDWDARAAANLETALRSLGPDAGRVFLYISPAVVERVGRTDPRAALGADVGPIFRALTAGGLVYLEMYRGDLSPFPAREMAMHPTRWLERWPADRAGALRLLLGPGGATGQEEIWNRVRATPAGRALLSHGPGYYAPAGRGTVADGAAWAAQLARFRAAPDASPPGGDVAVPVGGGVIITPPASALRPGGVIRLTTNRPGAAVVRLISAAGKVRIIKGSLRVGADGTAAIVLPKDVRAGNYRVMVTFQGDGLKDQVTIPVRIGSAAQAPPAAGSAPRGFRERLLQGQRVAQDAVRLLNAIDAWLDAGVTTGDLAPGGFGQAFLRSRNAPALAAGLQMAAGGVPAAPEPVAARPITPAPARGGGSGRVRVTPEQLLINQRISQAAVMRANALDARLAAGLTGGDLLGGAITPGKLAGGVRIIVSAEAPVPAPSESAPRPITRRSAKGLKVTSAQLSINLRISRAALTRARGLAERLTAGLTEEDFRDGSIVAANVAPSARTAPGGAP